MTAGRMNARHTVGAALLLGLLAGRGSADIRIELPQDTLVIQTPDEGGVAVLVKPAGQQIVLQDGQGKVLARLNAGAFERKLPGVAKGLTVSANEFTLQRGGRTLATVARESATGKAAVCVVRSYKPGRNQGTLIGPAVGTGSETWTTVRIATPNGELCFELSDQSGLELFVGKGGKEVKLRDGETGKDIALALPLELPLAAGRKQAGNGLKLTTTQFELKRDGKKIAAVSREVVPPPATYGTPVLPPPAGFQTTPPAPVAPSSSGFAR